MTKKSEIGALGEKLACDYLVDKGYKIIERNHRKPWGELDIVVKAKDNTIVFVEVKTINYYFSQGLLPEEQMTASKLKKFKRAATLYAGYHENLINSEKGWRLDLITLTLNPRTIKHYENIA